MFSKMRMGRPKGKSGNNAHPLRKIIGYDGLFEVLECGHLILPRRDFVGETFAIKRRCWKCPKRL